MFPVDQAFFFTSFILIMFHFIISKNLFKDLKKEEMISLY